MFLHGLGGPASPMAGEVRKPVLALEMPEPRPDTAAQNIRAWLSREVLRAGAGSTLRRERAGRILHAEAAGKRCRAVASGGGASRVRGWLGWNWREEGSMIVEERTYILHTYASVNEYLAIYASEGLPVQLEVLGGFLGYFSTEIGVQNQLVHLWGYENLEVRRERRAKLAQQPAWQACLKKIRLFDPGL